MRKTIMLLLAVLFLLTGCQTEEAEQTAAYQDSPAGAGAIVKEYCPEETEPVDQEAIQEQIRQIAEEYGAVGVQIAVVENGAVTDTYTYGWATLDTDPMTDEHKFRAASISKLLVGIGAMLLEEEGVISLDEDISEYWGTAVYNPTYPDVPITIRGMLTHTSSIACYGDGYSLDYYSVRSRLTSGYSSQVPGQIESWCYNNYAFGVLGMTLELAAGERLEDLLQETLFAPLNIDASFASGQIQGTDKLVTLYRDGGNTVERTVSEQQSVELYDSPGETGKYFAGGLTSSAEDLAKVIAMLAGDGTYEGIRILSAETVAQMEEYDPQLLESGGYQAMPMRYATDIYGREGVYYQQGYAYGMYGCVSYDPLTGDGVVVLTTGADGTENERGICQVCAAFQELLYRAYE